jgi:hypothetical protein
MKKLTVSELRAVAQILQNRPRVSAMEDPDFCASVLQLIGDTRRTFMGVKDISLYRSVIAVAQDLYGDHSIHNSLHANP